MKTLFYGGDVITMAQPPTAQALLAENGRIAAVGDAAELWALAGPCREVNLEGAALLPGFVDAHGHFSQMAAAQLQVNLEGAESAEEIRRRVKTFLEEHPAPAGQWVAGRGLGNAPLTLEALDSFAPGHPLVLHHQSGHMGYVNSMGLSALGLTPDTPDPEGGKLGRAGGRLTGYLEENAFVSQLRNIPLPSMEQLLQGYRAVQDIYAAQGITLVQDGMVTPELLPAYRALLRQDWLKLDVAAYTAPEDYAQFAGELPRTGHLTLSGPPGCGLPTPTTPATGAMAP